MDWHRASPEILGNIASLAPGEFAETNKFCRLPYILVKWRRLAKWLFRSRFAEAVLELNSMFLQQLEARRLERIREAEELIEMDLRERRILLRAGIL